MYSSPFRYNLFKSIPDDLPIFGLFTNVQKNTNSDSCDIWFNLHADPLFVNNDTLTILDSNSPAIGAASDGTNIGYYQGKGAANSVSNKYNARNGATMFSIHSLQNRKILIPEEYANSPSGLLIYNVAGRCICKKALAGNQNTVSLPFNLPSGAYVGMVISHGRTLTSKLIFHE
jgi:hypothetical protein